MSVGIDTQIASVAREIALRRNVYPKWVQAGRMKEAEAAKELAAMEAVMETLKAVKAGFDAAQNGNIAPTVTVANA